MKPVLCFLLFFAFYGQTHVVTSSKSPVPLFLVEDHSTPLVHLSFVFENAGFANDPIEKAGASNLASLLFGEWVESKHKRDLEKAGVIDQSLDINYRTLEIGILVTKSHLKEGVQFVFDLYKKWILERDKFRSKKLDYMNSLFSIEQANPSATLALRWYGRAFGATPLGYPMGSPDTIQSLNPQDVETHFTKRLGRDNMVCFAAGDVSLDELKKLVESIVKGLPETHLPTVSKRVPEVSVTKDSVLFQLDRPQSHGFFGLKGVDGFHPDYFALALLADALGASFTSRLWTKLREEQGLVYAINFSVVGETGTLEGGFSSDNDKVGFIQKQIKSMLEEVQLKGITEEELELGKQLWLNQLMLPLTSLQGITALMTKGYERGIDPGHELEEYRKKIQAVTLEDVNLVAKKYLDTNAMVFLTVGDAPEDTLQEI